jgi:23S rRNA (adenine2030-N6)-methyltransferase
MEQSPAIGRRQAPLSTPDARRPTAVVSCAMNYRHAYHAGNFADVVKHAVLALVIDYLKRKPAPFRIIETHAGSGRYALDAEAAAKTREWEGGIGRLLGADAAPLPPPVAARMAPYLDAVRAENADGGLRVYPGSPLIAHRLMREHDTLVLNELQPEEHARLRTALAGDRRVKVLALDGWLALKAQLPPKERRGLVLIDPPFEQEGELQRLADGLAEGMRRFASGVYLAWYPIKDPGPLARLYRAAATAAGDLHGGSTGSKALRIELMLRRPVDPERLNGCGLLVINAPHTLAGDLTVVLPEMARRLSDGSGAHCHIGPILDPGGPARRSDTPYRRKRTTP